MTELDELWRLTRDTIGTGRLSVVMPVYNLSATIEENLVATAELFDSHSIRAELVPVDDGSADGTADAIRRAMEALDSGMTPDAVLTDAEEALDALGELTGRTAREEIVSRIFSRFCVGK